MAFGGDFPYVNGKAQQGLVRFAKPTPAAKPPKKEGPRLAGADWAPTLQTGSSSVRLNMAKANWDRDDRDLTYTLVRDGVPVASVPSQVVKSTFWNRPALTFLDTGVVGGSTHSYRLTATDGDQNKAESATVSIVVKT